MSERTNRIDRILSGISRQHVSASQSNMFTKDFRKQQGTYNYVKTNGTMENTVSSRANEINNILTSADIPTYQTKPATAFPQSQRSLLKEAQMNRQDSSAAQSRAAPASTGQNYGSAAAEATFGFLNQNGVSTKYTQELSKAAQSPAAQSQTAQMGQRLGSAALEGTLGYLNQNGVSTRYTQDIAQTAQKQPAQSSSRSQPAVNSASSGGASSAAQETWYKDWSADQLKAQQQENTKQMNEAMLAGNMDVYNLLQEQNKALQTQLDEQTRQKRQTARSWREVQAELDQVNDELQKALAVVASLRGMTAESPEGLARAQNTYTELQKRKSQLERELKESQNVFSLSEEEKTAYSRALETLEPQLDMLYEKSQRRGLSVEEYQQFETMYNQYLEAYNALANEYRNPKWGEVLFGTLEQGAGQVVGSVTSFTDMLLGGFAQEVWTLAGQTIGHDLGTNPISALNNYVQNTRAADAAYYAEAAGDSRIAQNVNKYGTIVAAAVPAALLALMTSGGSLAGAATTESLAMTAAIEQSTGATQASLYMNQALQTLGRDPNAQFSFVQESGNAYQEALNDGADTGTAAIYATIYGLWAALVEVGGGDEALGGMQALPAQIRQALERGDRRAVIQYAYSIASEIGEENLQGALENGFKIIYGKEVPVFSMEDENAIINPRRMWEEAKGAGIASAVLGGGQAMVQAGINQRQNLQSEPWSGQPGMQNAAPLALIPNNVQHTAENQSGAVTVPNP